MKPHILLVEDNPDHVALIQRAFEQSAVQITATSSLHEARQLLATQSFDLIICDLYMPDGRSDELLAITDTDVPLPVVLMTGHGDEQTAVAALKAGALDYVVKTPATLLELPRIAERALRERRLFIERQQALQALQRSERLFRAMIERSSDAVLIVDRHGFVRYASPSTRRLLGYQVEGFLSQPVASFPFIHPADRERVKNIFFDLVQRSGASTITEFRVLRAGGGWRWIEATASNWLDDPAVEGVIVNYRDVTERKLMELRLQHGILHDALTGLPNRLLLSDRLAQAIKRSQRHPDYHFAVLFLDLDHFKFINDSFGHPVGDRFLVAVATRLYRCLRAIDTCARLGGDEFVVLLDDIASVEQAVSVAERILQQLDRPVEVDGHLLHSSASIGIVFGSAEYSEPAEVLRDADIAMYRAKAAGKSRYVVFQPVMREAAQARLGLENDLRRAVTLREFVVYYQPIVNIHSGTLIGFEALVRWQHPVRGLLTPAAFLDVAEEIGLGDAIGWQVMERVCRQLAEWRQTLLVNDLSIHVNLSARQFMLPDLYSRLVQLLEQYHLPPRSIKLELTESTLMEYNQEAAAVLASLRNYGIQIVIDDFGVGYSSLSYLIKLPIDQIKIDRNFIIQLNQDRHSEAIVSAIINLARGLHLTVVAEGLETAEQLERMRVAGCDYGQGYLLGYPLSAEEASRLLQQVLQ